MALSVKNPPGRKEEINKIKEAISANQNIILIGPRRVGKTTLLNAIEKQMENSKYRIVRYDCMGYKGNISALFAYLLAYTKPLKIFVSSIGKRGKGELGKERESAGSMLNKLGYNPFLIENFPDSDDPEKVEEDNIKDSDAFLLILGNEYSKEVEQEFGFAKFYEVPVFCMIKGKCDEERDNKVSKIIDGIRKNKEMIYHNYESIEEFEEVIEKTINKKDKEQREEIFKKYKNNEEWIEISEKFFESLKTQKEKRFLFLIDEFGELRKKDQDNKVTVNKNFEYMCAHLKAQIEKIKNNALFIITGSENVFTLYPQKYFEIFSKITIKPFERDLAISVLNEILTKKIDNELGGKIIEIVGTLPADLQLFVSKVNKNAKIDKSNLYKIVKGLMTDEGFSMQELFFEHLDKDTLKFLERIIPFLPASIDEIKTSFNEQKENLDELMKKVTEYYFILEKRDDNKYYPYSNLLYLSVINKNAPAKFEEIINNILK